MRFPTDLEPDLDPWHLLLGTLIVVVIAGMVIIVVGFAVGWW